MRKEQAESRLKLIVAILSLIYSGWMIWMLIPQHQRQLWQMKALATGRTAVRKCARRAGVAAMRVELETEQENYVLPYGLSRAAEWLGQAYDRTRDVQ